MPRCRAEDWQQQGQSDEDRRRKTRFLSRGAKRQYLLRLQCDPDQCEYAPREPETVDDEPDEPDEPGAWPTMRGGRKPRRRRRRNDACEDEGLDDAMKKDTRIPERSSRVRCGCIVCHLEAAAAIGNNRTDNNGTQNGTQNGTGGSSRGIPKEPVFPKVLRARQPGVRKLFEIVASQHPLALNQLVLGGSQLPPLNNRLKQLLLIEDEADTITLRYSCQKE